MLPVSAKTWIEVSANALRHNLHVAQAYAGSAQIIPVIKANGYGHGGELVAKALANETFPFFAIDSFEEAMQLYDVNPTPRLLILGYVPRDLLNVVVESGWSLVCSKIETIETLAVLATPEYPARIHLEIETGLYRQGADQKTLERLLAILHQYHDRFEVEGVCTHFANVEEGGGNAYPAQQEVRFEAAIKRLEQAGFSPKFRHIACSAALWTRSLGETNAVRLGISLYGMWSSTEVASFMAQHHPKTALQHALTWKTLIAEIKDVAADEPIGYGLTERVVRPTKLAVLPVGYADGFDRRLSSVSYVLIRGQRAKILGRVCMNMCMVDVTHIGNVSLEDEVVIFGEQGGEHLGPEEWEAWAPGMIAYEAVARLRSDIPRLLVDDGAA